MLKIRLRPCRQQLVVFKLGRGDTNMWWYTILSHQNDRNGTTEKIGNVKRLEWTDKITLVHELATPFALKKPSLI